MTENKANFCFQGHDESMKHSECNINKYVRRKICLGKKNIRMGKRLIKILAIFRANCKEKIMLESGWKTFSKETDLQGNTKEG